LRILNDIARFKEAFPSEEACIRFLEKARWTGGVIVSPFSGNEAYRITTRPGLYKCRKTRQNFSVRHGTIFEESRLPLKKWFFAIFVLTASPTGVSSIQLAKYLGVTQKTAWFMLRRIRYAVKHEAFSESLPKIEGVNAEAG